MLNSALMFNISGQRYVEYSTDMFRFFRSGYVYQDNTLPTWASDLDSEKQVYFPDGGTTQRQDIAPYAYEESKKKKNDDDTEIIQRGIETRDAEEKGENDA